MFISTEIKIKRLLHNPGDKLCKITSDNRKYSGVHGSAISLHVSVWFPLNGWRICGEEFFHLRRRLCTFPGKSNISVNKGFDSSLTCNLIFYFQQHSFIWCPRPDYWMVSTQWNNDWSEEVFNDQFRFQNRLLDRSPNETSDGISSDASSFRAGPNRGFAMGIPQSTYTTSWNWVEGVRFNGISDVYIHEM